MMRNNKILIALRIAEKIIRDDLDGVITGNAYPEQTERKNVECVEHAGSFFHIDTITCKAALKDYRHFKRALRLISGALNIL
jgi:hypothetical protein